MSNSTRAIYINILRQAVELHLQANPGAKAEVMPTHIGEDGLTYGIAYADEVGIANIERIAKRLEHLGAMVGEGCDRWYVFENGRRNGISGYILAKIYKRRSSVEKFAKRNGKPIWVTKTVDYAVSGKGEVGGFYEEYWNSGAGWQVGFMPVLPWVGTL